MLTVELANSRECVPWLQVPRNLKLIAVPIFELHDHVTRYGPVIAALPLLLSRLQFTLAMTHAAPSRPPAAASAANATDPPSQNQAPNFGGHGGVMPDVMQHAQHARAHAPQAMHSGMAAGHHGGVEGYGMM